MGSGRSIVYEIRRACAGVAGQATSVRINTDRIPAYAESLAPVLAQNRGAPPIPEASTAQRERAAAFWLTMDAINFGSGWFPTLRKAAGQSGYATISAALRRHFDRRGPWSASELTRLTAAELAGILGQDPRHELMALFARSLADLGRRLQADHEGSFLSLVEAARGSAPSLVETLADWDCFADTSNYAGAAVPFLKRAQIAAADLHRAGVAEFRDLAELTMFADNLVPHVLRLDGILDFAPDLVARIERGQLLEHGSVEEVEIRACAVHAVEMVVEFSVAATTAATVDQLLWNRGQLPRYKASPRHRSRCTAY